MLKTTTTTETRRPRLLDQMRHAIRVKHYSYQTEKSYLQWARRYILFHEKRHPAELGTEAVRGFLSHLAVDRHVSASTQNQALNALVFLYKQVLGVELPYALARKYPNADRQWCWQYVFPARDVSTDPRTGARRRHHTHQSVLQRAMKTAVRLAWNSHAGGLSCPAALLRYTST